jgi:hypothetical protein
MNLKNLLHSVIVWCEDHPLVTRAFHAFWQAALGYWIAQQFKVNPVVGTAAFGAGLSALKTYLVYLLKNALMNGQLG